MSSNKLSRRKFLMNSAAIGLAPVAFIPAAVNPTAVNPTGPLPPKAAALRTRILSQ